jgi:hypothetical protein
MDITAEAESVIHDLQRLVQTRRSQHQADLSGWRAAVLQRATTVLARLLEARAAEACLEGLRGSPAAAAELEQLIDALKTLRAKASQPLEWPR